MDVPEWLSKRGGKLPQGLNQQTRLVVLGGHPRYKLFATTAGGAYTCVVTETVNGKRIDTGKSYSGTDDALKGGLDELREHLGW